VPDFAEPAALLDFLTDTAALTPAAVSARP
jgi:hypothetical protein